jgi:hypothetical protein
MAKKNAKKALVSPKTSQKQDSRPVISVKVNESARIKGDFGQDKANGRQETEKPESNLKYAIIGVFIVVAIIAATVFLKGNANPAQDSKFPLLTNNIMVCSNNNAVCFLQNGSWYSTGYTMGTDLNAANNFQISNETVNGINSVFSRNKINLVFGSAEGTSSDNAQLIISSSPFSYYIGVYYTYEGQNKTISPQLLSEYNSSEPALIILGPGTGAKETSITFDGKNVVVQGETYEDLKLVLGKLLIVVIRGN